MLLWRKAASGGTLPDGAAVPRGALVVMEASGYRDQDLPRRFQLWRLYSPLITRYLVYRNKPTRKTSRTDEYDAYKQADGTARSSQIHLVSTGRLATQRWMFTDYMENRSRILRTCRFGISKVTPGAEIPETLKVSVEFELAAAVDPALLPALVFPWTDITDLTIYDAIEDEVSVLADDLEEDPADILKEITSLLNVPDKPADGWEINFEKQDAVKLDAGESHKLSVEIAAPTPGTLPLALSWTDLDSGEREVGDVIVVRRDESSPIIVDFADPTPGQST